MKPHQPTEGDLRLLDVVARQAADLIERARIETALRESEQQSRWLAATRAFSQPMTPVLPTERIAHLSHGRRLLRCGIFGAWANSRTACGGRLWPDRPRRPVGQRLCFEARWWDRAESVAMNENGIDTPEQALNLPRRSYVTPVEEAGQAIIAKIQKAADLSNENCDRAMALAHKLSMQLRAAEDRINQLQAEVELFRDRAARAERWLQTIQKEIEERLIAPRSVSGESQSVRG